MAARASGAAATPDGCDSWSDRSSMELAETTPRETWLCRSTVGAASDVEEDLCSERSDGDQTGCSSSSHSVEDEKPALGYDGRDDRQANCTRLHTQETATTEIKPTHTRSRKLTLGSHLDVARAHALRKLLPPLAGTPSGTAALNLTPHAAVDDKMKHSLKSLAVKRPSISKGGDRDKKKKEKRDGDGDSHLAIYMDYQREPGFGKSPKRREVFVVRHVGSIYVALFLSTACVHCVSFNVSPALRRLFRIDTLPVGLCIVVAWTILGVVNCLGAWVGRQGDRVMLLRKLSWLWIAAIVLLQLAKVLRVPSGVANALLGIGYFASVTAHGLMLPTAIAVGTQVVAAKAVASYHQHDEDSARRRQQSMEAAIGTFVTWSFGVILAASSLVQVFYFAGVNLELPSGEDVLVLRSRETITITIPCGTLLLAFLITFLFQSRHHYEPTDADTSATESSSSSSSSTPVGTSKAETRARNALERKLARGEFEDFALPGKESAVAPKRLGLRHWFQLARRSLALLAMGFFTLLLLTAVGATLIAQTVTDHSSSVSVLVHLVVFAVLLVGWVLTMLLSASQLGPSSRDKLYGHIDDLMVVPILPSRHQLFVFVALISLGSAAALAAFVRAQLYSTLFIQSCQLRRPRDAAILSDPNVIGAWVGLASALLLPSIHFALRRTKSAPPRVSAVRRVAIGVLLYLLAIFMSSVVELYRRASRWPADLIVVNPDAVGCNKTHPSNFTVLWSVPHLAVLSVADAVFRVGAAEEAHALTAPLDWLGVAQGVLSLADSVGYAAALALTKTLSPWLYHVKTSDLVLLLLLITAITSLSYALTRRLADHVHASRQPRPSDTKNDSNDDSDAERALADDEAESRHSVSTSGDAAGRKEAQRVAQDEMDRVVAVAPSSSSTSFSSSSRQRLSARALKIDRAGR